jgi:hypothetical protein
VAAKGFAVVTSDGEIFVRTVSPTEIGAIVNGLVTLCKVAVMDGDHERAIRATWEDCASRFDPPLWIGEVEIRIVSHG